MTDMGFMMAPYELPVCSTFKAKILNDQLCYEVDLGKYAGGDNVENDLKAGLVLFLDYNDDRQIKLGESIDVDVHEDFVDKVDASKDDEKALIYLHTIGETSLQNSLKYFDNLCYLQSL